MSNLSRAVIGLFIMILASMPTVWAAGHTQSDMNQNAYSKFKQIDDTLNSVYKQVLAEYQEDKGFTEKLVDAEVAWIAFRDAELEALYPEHMDKPWKYGSFLPTAFSTEKSKLTGARVQQLKEWLEGMPVDQITGNVDVSKLDGSQAEIKQKVDAELKQAEDALDDVCSQILMRYEENGIFIDRFIDAELAWSAFRDAELEAINAAQNKEKRYGRFSPVAYELEKARLTWARVVQLKEWSEGLPEGFVGAGSRGVYRSSP